MMISRLPDDLFMDAAGRRFDDNGRAVADQRLAIWITCLSPQKRERKGGRNAIGVGEKVDRRTRPCHPLRHQIIHWNLIDEGDLIHDGEGFPKSRLQISTPSF